MSLQINNQQGINLTRKFDASAYLQKKGEIMSKQMVLRGKVFYAHCKYQGIHIRDCLGTNDPEVAEDKLRDLQFLVRKGEYNAWKATFEESADVWLATRNMGKPHHRSQEVWVRNHLIPYFGKQRLETSSQLIRKLVRVWSMIY